MRKLQQGGPRIDDTQKGRLRLRDPRTGSLRMGRLQFRGLRTGDPQMMEQQMSSRWVENLRIRVFWVEGQQMSPRKGGSWRKRGLWMRGLQKVGSWMRGLRMKSRSHRPLVAFEAYQVVLVV